MPTGDIKIRPIAPRDQAEWSVLWEGYNAFYGRAGPTALAEAITQATWQRFFDAQEPVHALVATHDDKVIGLVHYLFHRSTTRLNDVCYLQDLFTASAWRGHGAGRLLIQAVYDAARARGSSRVYWTTYTTNATARALYDQVAEHLGAIVYTHEL